jgi:D-glycero-alpha-D-manno-heptose-7-phosphate kinase
MIISRTPYRISFFGGGTDYPAWFEEHVGAVLATSINKYCYITCRYLPPFFEHKYRVVYSKIESCMTIDDIKHPSVRAVLKYLNIDRGIEIHHDGDLPARSGMGSSSAFTVGLLNAIYALRGVYKGKYHLAKEGIYIEQEALKETVGCQDQILSAYGGLNHVVFPASGQFTVSPLILPQKRIEELESHLLLFYTGIKRTASDVAQSYVQDMNGSSRKRQLRIIKDLVEESITILSKGDNISAFGELLHEAWHAKKSLSPKVSNSEIDDIYEIALSAGAIGGKLTGAGGGGFMLLFVPPSRHQHVKEKLNKLIHVPFNFEFSGSQIIFFDPEEDYSYAERYRSSQDIEKFRELTEVKH